MFQSSPVARDGCNTTILLLIRRRGPVFQPSPVANDECNAPAANGAAQTWVFQSSPVARARLAIDGEHHLRRVATFVLPGADLLDEFLAPVRRPLGGWLPGSERAFRQFDSTGHVDLALRYVHLKRRLKQVLDLGEGSDRGEVAAMGAILTSLVGLTLLRGQRPFLQARGIHGIRVVDLKPARGDSLRQQLNDRGRICPSDFSSDCLELTPYGLPHDVTVADRELDKCALGLIRQVAGLSPEPRLCVELLSQCSQRRAITSLRPLQHR